MNPFHHRIAKRALSPLFFLCSIAIVSFYIFGAANMYLSSDTADTLLWAQASLESGKLVNPDFYYAAILPVGGHLLMIPFVAIFGLTVTAQSWGMFVFFLFFVAALLFFLLSCGLGRSSALWISAIIILSTLVSDVSRIIFYQHILYYSQGLLYLFIGMGLILRILRLAQACNASARINLLFIILFVWIIFTSINGEMTLAIFTVPLVGAIVLERLLNVAPLSLHTMDDKVNIKVVAFITCGTIIGLFLRLFLMGNATTAYADSITSFSPWHGWQVHIGNFFTFWIVLSTTHVADQQFASVAGVVNLVQLFASLAILIVPWVSLFQYRSYKERWERLVVLAHWVLTAVLMCLFVFSRYGEANWRLIPLYTSSIITMFVVFRHSWRSSRLVARRFTALIASTVIVSGLWSAYFTWSLPNDITTVNMHGLIEFLDDHELTDGYDTFWNAIAPTVYSGERIKVRQVIIKGSTIAPQPYQSNKTWYTKHLGKSFLLVTAGELKEFDPFIPQDYQSMLLYGDDHIYVYDYDVIELKQ